MTARIGRALPQRHALARRAFLLEELLGEPYEIDDPLEDGRYEQAFGRIAACVEALVSWPRDRQQT